MKKLSIIFFLLLTLQLTILYSSRNISASASLPASTDRVIQTHQIPSPTPQPNLKKRQLNNWQFHNPKMDSLLNRKMERALLDSLEENQATSQPENRRDQQSTETICVYVKCEAKHRQAVEKSISRLDGTVTGHNRKETTIQALIPLTSLNSLTNLKEVNFIKTPHVAVAYTGANDSEALTEINADNWHNAGFFGQGIKVGIIDIGFNGYTDLLGSELPPTVSVQNFVDGEDEGEIDNNSISSHGTACAEVIYDLAPQATLFLAKIETHLDLQDAVDWLIDEYNVDIISTSFGFYNVDPGDGTGELADIVNEAYNAGIIWVTAAGNDRQRHWGGDFYDPDDDDVHNFSDNNEYNLFLNENGDNEIEAGIECKIFVRWNDWQNVDQDYDLYVYRWDIEGGTGWEYLGKSQNDQNGAPGQTPTEAVTFITYGSATVYGFTIETLSATKTVNFEISAPNNGRLHLSETLASRSLPNLADAARATTVSAIDTFTHIQETYSSEGPTNGPGGSAAGGLDKPDIAAYTNVTTDSFGNLGFSGTSAATAHVAGTAALILSKNPSLSPAKVQESLKNQAIDIGDSGFEYTTGWGRLHLYDQAVWLGNSTTWDRYFNWNCDSVPESTTSVTIPSSPAGGSYWPLVSDTPARAIELLISGQLTIINNSLIIGN